MNKNVYILEYKHLCQGMMQNNTKLTDAVLTFKLTDGTRVTDDEGELASTISSNLNFEQMKLTLKQLLVSHTSTQNDVLSVKQDEMFHGRKFDQPDKKNKYR